MTTETNKPAFNIVRYYGEGRNRDSGRVGAAWHTEKGNLIIVIENPFGQGKIIFNAFPNVEKPKDDVPMQAEPGEYEAHTYQ